MELLLTHVRERRGSVEYLAQRAGQQHIVATVGECKQPPPSPPLPPPAYHSSIAHGHTADPDLRRADWALVAQLQAESDGGGTGSGGSEAMGRRYDVASEGEESDASDGEVDLSGTVSASQLPPPPPRMHIPRNYSNSSEYWQPEVAARASSREAPPRVSIQRV